MTQMNEAFDYFIASMDSNRMRKLHVQEVSVMTQMVDVVREEQCVYDLFFNEVIRETAVQCKQRGQLLAKIRSHYASLFVRMPELCIQMARELEFVQGAVTQFQQEQATFRDQLFEQEVALNEYKERYHTAVDKVDELKLRLQNERLGRERESKIFTQFKMEFADQRARLEAEVQQLRAEKEDRLAVDHNFKKQLAEMQIPDHLVYSLLDESKDDVDNSTPSQGHVHTATTSTTNTTTAPDSTSSTAMQTEPSSSSAPAVVPVAATTVTTRETGQQQRQQQQQQQQTTEGVSVVVPSPTSHSVVETFSVPELTQRPFSPGHATLKTHHDSVPSHTVIAVENIVYQSLHGTPMHP
jgi:hypothetical protein